MGVFGLAHFLLTRLDRFPCEILVRFGIKLSLRLLIDRVPPILCSRVLAGERSISIVRAHFTLCYKGVIPNGASKVAGEGMGSPRLVRYDFYDVQHATVSFPSLDYEFVVNVKEYLIKRHTG